MALPIVAVVGRPNVGKSTFVNRIAQATDAIVHEARGVTRDRSYHRADWNGIDFLLIDTGGIEAGGIDEFQTSIRTQALMAAEEADQHDENALDEQVGLDEAAPRVGRLVQPDEGFGEDRDGQEIARDVGIDGAGASAEEAAMHITQEPESPLG